MGTDEFLKLAENAVRDYVGYKDDYDVYVVWNCKTLQNNKAILATSVSDHLFFEVTYNGDKKELYLDVYKKEKNVCIKL